MLHIFAEADAAGMWADRDAGLVSHQHDRDHFIDARQAARINLAESNRLRLKELFEHHLVVRMLAGCELNRCDLPGDFLMAQHIIRARRFFHPVNIVRRDCLDGRDRLINVPDLIGVDAEFYVLAERLTEERAAAHIGGEIAANLDLEMPPTFRIRCFEKLNDLGIRIADPACGCCVGGIAFAREELDPRRLSGRLLRQPFQGLLLAEEIADMAEINGRDDLLG